MQGRKRSTVTSAGIRKTGEPLREIPEPPAYLRPRAAENFRQTCGFLIASGSITSGDVPLVERYAATLDRWQSAEERLAKDTLHWERLVDRKGDDASSVPLPAMAQSIKMGEQLSKLESALGLNPVERSRLPTNEPETTAMEEIDALIRRSARDGGE
jgi:P27 family predicted phage terminase small subunit